jgi:large subunit ribosomal protein L15e
MNITLTPFTLNHTITSCITSYIILTNIFLKPLYKTNTRTKGESMALSAYHYIQETFQQEYKERSEEYRKRLQEWRKQGTVVRVENPTNLARARRLGFKRKRGYVIVRVRIPRGRRVRPKPKGGRKPRHNYIYVQPQISHRLMAEQKANRKFKNLEVLNSYWVGEDGNYKYFEVIMIDPEIVDHPIAHQKGRAFRGLTSAGRKMRGLRAKGRKRSREGSQRRASDV